MSSQSVSIFYPLLGMFALVIITLGRLAYLRLNGVARKKIPINYFVTYEGTIPTNAHIANRHLINLFELPVLFYVIVILIYVTQKTDSFFIWMSWFYVICRAGHTYIHLTFNNIRLRFAIYLLSTLVLIVIWIRFFWMLP